MEPQVQSLPKRRLCRLWVLPPTAIPAKPALATCSAKFPATVAPVPVAGCEAPASDDATAPALALGAAAAAAGAALLL